MNWLKGDSTELRQCKPFAASGAGQTFNVGGFGSVVSVVASFMEIPSLKELETIALGMQHRVTGQATLEAPGCFYSIMSNSLSRFPLLKKPEAFSWGCSGVISFDLCSPGVGDPKHLWQECRIPETSLTP